MNEIINCMPVAAIAFAIGVSLPINQSNESLTKVVSESMPNESTLMLVPSYYKPDIALTFDTVASRELPMWECSKLVARCDAIDPRTPEHLEVCGSMSIRDNDIDRWIYNFGVSPKKYLAPNLLTTGDI